MGKGSSVSVLDGPLVFVDIETNGMSHLRGRVIEVAAIRVEGGEIVQEFNSLVDPQSELPFFITNLTGITTADAQAAPTFDQIADELHELLDEAVFVAHNVRFDYSFLKQEFKRVGKTFLPRQLCTVKLSRALYPQERSHKLESLIQRHGFTFSQRHRAYDDAAVLLQFVRLVRREFPAETIETAIAKQLRQPALPKAIAPELVQNLPDGPGVYIFEGEAGRTLYVGKSVNIRKRVLSHFGRDHAESKEFKMAQLITHIRAHETNGELSALLLESRLVKELQPVYNRQLRRLQQMLCVRAEPDEQGYLQLELVEVSEIDAAETADILAVYPRRGRAKESLQEIAKTFDLCPKLMGLEKASQACFWQQLGKCRGACAGKEEAEIYNRRLLMAFERQRIQAWPYKGPVLIEEALGNEVQGIVVDQWCVIGELKQEPYCDPVLEQHGRQFDLDTYKILQQFLLTKLDKLRVQPLSPGFLNMLAS